MPVVINEFEVVDNAQPAARAGGEAAAPATPPLPDAQDLRRLLAEQAEQQLRLWSH